MRVMSIEFLDRYGQRFDAGTAFVHTLGYSLSMAFVLPQLISVALMMISRRGSGTDRHGAGLGRHQQPRLMRTPPDLHPA